MRAAPAVSRACCKQECCTRAYRNSGEHPAFPAQWLYSLYVVALVTGFVCHHHRAKHLLRHDLTSAPGRQALTTSPYATSPFVFVLTRPPRPAPRLRRWPTPLWVGQDGGSYRNDLPDGAIRIFFRERLDRFLQPGGDLPVGLFCRSRSRKIALARAAKSQAVNEVRSVITPTV